MTDKGVHVPAFAFDRLQAERDSLRAQLAARDERIKRLEEALEAGIALLEKLEEECVYDNVLTYLKVARAALSAAGKADGEKGEEVK
jgi:hypothetical protein